MASLTVGVAGGTGSGKTTLTRKLVERFPGKSSVVFHDNYYKAHDDLAYEERCLLNYDPRRIRQRSDGRASSPARRRAVR